MRPPSSDDRRRVRGPEHVRRGRAAPAAARAGAAACRRRSRASAGSVSRRRAHGARRRRAAAPSGRSVDSLEPVELDGRVLGHDAADCRSVKCPALMGYRRRSTRADEASRHRRRRLHRLDRGQPAAGGRPRGRRARQPRARPSRGRARRRAAGRRRPARPRRGRATWSARGSTACCTSRPWRWSASRSAIRSAITAPTSAERSTCSRRCASAGVPRLVFSSTCAVYGQPDEVPIPETAPPRPSNAYGASKLAVDGMIGDFCRAHGLGAVSLRYFNVAGASGGLRRGSRARDAPDPEHPARRARGSTRSASRSSAPTTRRRTAPRSATTSTSRISPTAHLLALEGARPGEHQIFNLGNGNGFSVREVIAAAREVTGAEIADPRGATAARRPADAGRRERADPRGARLGARASRRSRDMVADAWEFAQAHPRGYSE